MVSLGFFFQCTWAKGSGALLWSRVVRLSSVPPSIVRPSLTFHIFNFSSETTELNSTKLDRKQDLNVLYQVCVFRVDRKNKMAALASDWLRHFQLLLLNHWTEFNETWQEARSQCPLPSLCFFGPVGKTRWPPWPLIGWDIFDFSSETAERNSTKLKRKQDLNVLYQICVFRSVRKNRWPPWPLIGWDIFDFSSETAEQNSTKLDRKQDLKVLYQVCVFSGWSVNKCPPWPIPQKGGTLYSGARYVALWASCFLVHLSLRLKCTIVIMCCPSSIVRPSVRPSSVRPSSLTFHIFDFSSETTERNLTKLYRKVDLNVLYQVCVFRADRKNKMAALASDWLRHFRILFWNRSTEFNETWQEARSQRPLPSLCFSGQSEKQDGRPGLWLAETFSTSPLKPLNGIQRNLIGSKISTSSTKFVFFGPIGKTRWPPWPLIGWDIFDFSSETSERNSTKLDRKQDLNVLYQVCVFRADRKNKMAALASDWLRHFRLLLWNLWTEFNETWQEARSQRPLPSLCFSGR